MQLSGEHHTSGSPSTRRQTSLQESFLRAQHAAAVKDACSREAMLCFWFDGPHTEYKLPSNESVNVFPGVRNYGNTCWLNASLQCFMHSAPIRAYLLRDDVAMTTLETSLKRFCKCYWALSGIPPHSILAPVDVLTALMVEWPQFGGAIQQDVGEILQCLRIAPVTAIALPPHRTTICVEGITHAALDVRTLQKSNISLQHLWDNVAIDWDTTQCHPSCLVVVFPSVYPTDDGGHCYSSLVVTDADAPVQAGSGSTK